MKDEVNLYVHAVFPDGEIVRAGRILSRRLGMAGRREGFFRYDPSFLAHRRAYAIDPVHLPLEERVFEGGNGETGLPAVFEDSLPDAWGRHILARKGGLEGARFAPAHLLSVLGGEGLGRFLYSEQETRPAFTDISIAFADIAAALVEAARFEESIDTDAAELQHLLACGSSAGGARPKVLTEKGGQLWIAKFASRNDIHPELFVALEEAGLSLAAMAGLEIPEFSKEMVEDRALLLVRRFDATPQKGRNAIVSFRTLTGVYDQYAVSYGDLADVLRRFSHQPGKDLELLYRHMCVNILLVNTDDHLQNFSMLHTDSGWRLSPSYDIAPNIYQTEQILKVNGRHAGITADDIIAEGKRCGLSIHRCREALRDVLAATAAWEEVFAQCRVPEPHTGRLRQTIRQRFREIGRQLAA